MRLVVVLVVFLAISKSIFGQEGEVYWVVKRGNSLTDEAYYKLKFLEGEVDFNILNVLDFTLTKDSSLIGSWFSPNIQDPTFSAFFGDENPNSDEIAIEQYYSMRDTIFKDIYHVKSDSLWITENRHNNDGLFYLKEYYQGKPILQPYMLISNGGDPYKVDYFYAIPAKDSSLIQFRKTYSFSFNCENMNETLSSLQTNAAKTLLVEMQQIAESKDEKTKDMIYEVALKNSSNFVREFTDGLTQNIENYIDSNEAIVNIMSNGLKYNDAKSVLQENIKKKQLYRANDNNTLGWYKIPTSVTNEVVVRLFEKNAKYYVAIIHDVSMTIIETSKSSLAKDDLKFTPVSDGDILKIEYFIIQNQGKTLGISVMGQSSNHVIYHPTYDEWYCDIFFSQRTLNNKVKYPWK